MPPGYRAAPTSLTGTHFQWKSTSATLPFFMMPVTEISSLRATMTGKYFDTTVLLGIKSRNVSTPSGVRATSQHGGGAMVGEHGTFTPVIQPRRCNTIYSGER